uniref:Uncharacterized protein n=1 Tax=Anguilla anguilla TaxID=7936 RepID=A0A0E9V1F9_ANGAN
MSLETSFILLELTIILVIVM